MYTLLKPIIVRQELIKRRLKIFTPFDFVRIFEINSLKTKYFLEKESQINGFLIRLKKGLYALKTDMPSDEEIANSLYKPSYISFEYALSRYGIIPEATYAITSATTKITREFEVEDKKFTYLSIKKQAYIGFNLVKVSSKNYFIATPEKALVDYLYFVSLGLKTLNDRMILNNLNKKRVYEYAERFKRKGLINLLKNTLI